MFATVLLLLCENVGGAVSFEVPMLHVYMVNSNVLVGIMTPIFFY